MRTSRQQLIEEPATLADRTANGAGAQCQRVPALEEAARNAVEELAYTPMNLPLEDWSRISSTVLSALDTSNRPGTFDLDQIAPDQLVNISRPESQRALEPSAARSLAMEERLQAIEQQLVVNLGYFHDEKRILLETLQSHIVSHISAIRALSSPDHADAGKVEGDGGAAARDVLAERRRQIEAEGWDHYHDDANERAELAQAAACYALSGTPADEAVFIHGRWEDPRDLFWPHGWSREWWKPTNRRRDLVKAGALILAEIERIDRLPSAPSQEVAG